MIIQSYPIAHISSTQDPRLIMIEGMDPSNEMPVGGLPLFSFPLQLRNETTLED